MTPRRPHGRENTHFQDGERVNANVPVKSAVGVTRDDPTGLRELAGHESLGRVGQTGLPRESTQPRPVFALSDNARAGSQASGTAEDLESDPCRRHQGHHRAAGHRGLPPPRLASGCASGVPCPISTQQSECQETSSHVSGHSPGAGFPAPLGAPTVTSYSVHPVPAASVFHGSPHLLRPGGPLAGPFSMAPPRPPKRPTLLPG